jgi:hypothetical protein
MSHTMIPCPTPSCANFVAKWKYPHRVSEHNGVLTCENCGGISHDGGKTWKHECRTCKVTVEPGKLVGLFVPHLCVPCENAEAAKSGTCGNCRQRLNRCCC